MRKTNAFAAKRNGSSGAGFLASRWKWTTSGVATGMMTVLLGLLQHPSLGLATALVGFVFTAATLVTFLIIGPSSQPNLAAIRYGWVKP